VSGGKGKPREIKEAFSGDASSMIGTSAQPPARDSGRQDVAHRVSGGKEVSQEIRETFSREGSPSIGSSLMIT
jgi:hypothetical protein